MSPRFILIGLSLAANVALGIVLWRQREALPEPVAPAPAKPMATVASMPEEVPLAKTWSRMKGEGDPSAFIARLRAAGFPERVVRSLLDYQLWEKYADEVAAFRRRDNAAQYWRWEGHSPVDLQEAARLRAIEQEVIEERRRILGPEGDRFLPGDYGYSDEYRYGTLSATKVSALRAINKDYDQLANQIRTSTRGDVFPDDREKLVQLEKERKADIARLLTPEELEQQERRDSPAANFARTTLRYLDPSEADFLTLYRLRHDFDERYGVTNLTPAQTEKRSQAQAELTKQIEAALGPERFAEYQIVNDGNYGDTRTFVTGVGLTPDAARTLVGWQRDFAQRAADVQADASLTLEQRVQRLAALQQEAVGKVGGSLGDEKMAAYRKLSVGQWISDLTQPDRIWKR